RRPDPAHPAVEFLRPAGAGAAHGLRCPGPAGRPAAGRPAVRRGDPVPRRRRLRGRHRLAPPRPAAPGLRRISMLRLAVLVAALFAASAAAQDKKLYLAAYGGSFEETMKKIILPPFELQHGVKVEYVAGNSTTSLARLQAQKDHQEINLAILD